MMKPTRMLFGLKRDPRSIERRIVRTSVFCLCLLFAAGTVAQQEAAGIGHSSKPTFITFEARGAGKGMRQGTVPLSINAAGTIAGYYIDANSARHGFVRAATGKITTFNVSGAGTGSNEGTFPIRINSLGVIAGYYVDGSNVYHGFERVATGKINKFNVSRAGTGAGQGTGILSINAAGEIAGTYIDASNVYQGFVRDAKGNYARSAQVCLDFAVLPRIPNSFHATL